MNVTDDPPAGRRGLYDLEGNDFRPCFYGHHIVPFPYILTPHYHYSQVQQGHAQGHVVRPENSARGVRLTSSFFIIKTDSDQLVRSWELDRRSG